MVGFLGGQSLDTVVSSDLKACGSLEPSALQRTLSIAVAFLSCADAAHLSSALEEACASHGLKAKACKSAVRSLVLVLGGAVKFGLSSEALGADLASIGMDEARAALVVGCYAAQREALSQLAVDRAVDASLLLDAEWRFGVTVSTDDVGRVGSSFVHLRLVTAGSTPGAPPQAHAVEMSVPAFYTFLASLEKAQGYTNLLGALSN